MAGGLVVEEFAHARFVEDALGDELFGLDGRAFLEEFAGVRGHAAGEDAADIGVVGAGGDVEDDFGGGPGGLEGR